MSQAWRWVRSAVYVGQVYVMMGVIGIVFNEAMHRIVRAFEDRARALHGT